MRKLDNIKEIESFRKLEENWNGYNANKLSEEVIEKAIVYVKGLRFQPLRVLPTPRNSIQFEYEIEGKGYLEFEVFKNVVVYFEVEKEEYDKAICEEIKENEFLKMNKIVEEFYRKNRVLK